MSRLLIIFSSCLQREVRDMGLNEFGFSVVLFRTKTKNFLFSQNYVVKFKQFR